MPGEMSWAAANKKLGMTPDELGDILKTVRQCHPGTNWRIKATVGFGGQLQKITFVEVD